jgi:DNA-binding MarR family transcriptional regulator
MLSPADESREKRKGISMDHTLASPQTQAVLDFMLFLNDTLSRTSQQFENETSCSPEEANVIHILAQHGPLMVKDIKQALPGMDPSKLTRLLDSLEARGYATRTINRENRRSFLVTPTERGMRLLGEFTHDLEVLAQNILSALTPTERLILVELFTKIQAAWKAPDNQRET